MKILFFFYSIFCLIPFLSGCNLLNSSSYQNNVQQLHHLSSRYVAVKNGQIEYYQFGNGSPIVLIPGYATDVSSWNRYFLTTLALHHEIIILNNRNVGRSYVKSHFYKSQDLANDTYQLIQVLKLKKPTIIGISMGGMIAQQLVVLHPNEIGDFVLINTLIAGKQAVSPSQVMEKKLLNLPKNKIGFYIAAIDLFFPPSRKIPMAYSLAVNCFQPRDYKEIDFQTVMPQQQTLIRSWLKDNVTAKKISKLQLPVLIINGEADAIIPPINSVILANNIPHSQLIKWKNGGHAIIYQYPYEIGKIINNFIAR